MGTVAKLQLKLLEAVGLSGYELLAENFMSVRNGTVGLPHRCHCESMPHKKTKKELRSPLFLDVKKEMAEPRMAKSAKMMELNLDTARIPDQPSSSLPGTVDKIIPSHRTTKLAVLSHEDRQSG
jgi:hypothetical protein